MSKKKTPSHNDLAVPENPVMRTPWTVRVTAASPKEITFESGAKRSKVMPRYDLIPISVLTCLADQLQLGAEKYGEYNWVNGLDDPKYLRDALNHMQVHLSDLIAQRASREIIPSQDNEWGNIGAILFGCMVLATKVESE